MTRRRSSRREPTAIGLAALRPQPMTAAAVADLIERARATSDSKSPFDVHHGGWSRLARVGSRLVALVGGSYSDAARTLRQLTGYDLSHDGVRRASVAIYGGRPPAPMPPADPDTPDPILALADRADTQLTAHCEQHRRLSMDDQVNYDVLARFWPLRPYGQPGWWQYVGRQRRQRNGLTQIRTDRGPRGRCGDIKADAISGEVSR